MKLCRIRIFTHKSTNAHFAINYNYSTKFPSNMSRRNRAGHGLQTSPCRFISLPGSSFLPASRSRHSCKVSHFAGPEPGTEGAAEPGLGRHSRPGAALSAVSPALMRWPLPPPALGHHHHRRDAKTMAATTGAAPQRSAGYKDQPARNTTCHIA